MAAVVLKFNEQLKTSDPESKPVLIIGQLSHLLQLEFSHIKKKLKPRVNDEIFSRVMAELVPSNCGALYRNSAVVATLPKYCSRHNAPSRPHALTKFVKNFNHACDHCIVIVCPRKDIFASSCAVARAFPLFSRKSTNFTKAFTVTVEFVITDGNGDVQTEISASDVACLSEVASAIRDAARIVDSPCSEMNTDDFLREIISVGKELGITPKIYRGEELKERGFGGIYNVGKAAENPPALAVLSHIVPDAEEDIALVGKGIVYDTGGLSIKSKTSMPGMKRDCGGAAAVLEAFYVAVKLGFRDNLHVVLCLAENSVGPKSMRPDDIITMYSGRTVEVNNTDAEGRLVLGDGVSYAVKDLKAGIVLDMATLTGAQGTSTGKYHAACITNQEHWERAVVSAGQVSGDLVHPLPYCPELHFTEFSSVVADMKNSVADRSNAQSSCAGLFIASHIGFDYPGIWIHVDMASPVINGERATGYGVALLLTLFGYASKNPLLESLAPANMMNGQESEKGNKKMKFI